MTTRTKTRLLSKTLASDFLKPAGLAALLLAGGCATPPMADMIIGPGYVPSNIYGRNWATYGHLKRVAVLPIVAPEKTGAETLQPVLLGEIAKAKAFEFVPVTRSQVRQWSAQAEWEPGQPLPTELLQVIREKLDCDGILATELTRYSPYPPLAIGWKFKLADAKNMEILWAADEVFDASDPAVVNGARRYHRDHATVTGPLADSRAILLSPTAFGHYSAATLVSTLGPEAK